MSSTHHKCACGVGAVRVGNTGVAVSQTFQIDSELPVAVITEPSPTSALYRSRLRARDWLTLRFTAPVAPGEDAVCASDAFVSLLRSAPTMHVYFYRLVGL